MERDARHILQTEWNVRLNSKLLEYFLRVAELGSINKAAVDLRISQPALSRNVSLLEHEMGTTLFHRSRGGVTLTEPGKMLYENARPLLRHFTTLKEQVGELAAGTVAIGLPPSWRSIVSVRIAEVLLKEHPDVKVRINETVSHALRDQLADGSLDLCVAPADSNVSDAFRQTRLVRDPMVLVGGAESKLFETDTVPLSKLDGLPMIIPSRPNIMRAKIEHELALMGMDLRVAIETDTLNLCMDLAARGDGYTVVPRCALLSIETTKGPQWARIADLDIVWSLFENTRRSHSHAVRYCRREIRKIVQAKTEEGDWTFATSLQ
jgi:LysR family nitrogen assimilation transcriptional regulator